MPKELKERKQEMVELRKKYWTLRMIGKRYGISKQRVAQIIGPTGNVSEIIEKKEGGIQKR